jgi:hypothetical protein
MFPKCHIAEGIKGVQMAIHFDPGRDGNSYWCRENEEARSKKEERLEGLCHFVFGLDGIMAYWNEKMVRRRKKMQHGEGSIANMPRQ